MTSHPEAVIPGWENIAYTNFSENHVNQILVSTLEAGYRCRLEVEVGNRLDEQYSGYVLQLGAGGVVLAEGNSSLSPAPGTDVTAALIYEADNGIPRLGQPREIGLTTPSPQANFDNVRLEKAALSVPAVNLPTLGRL